MTAVTAEALDAPAPLNGARILRLNALTGLVSGLVLVFCAPTVSQALGLAPYALAVPIAQVVGVGLITFAALLLWIARRPIPPATMLAVGVIDAVWVAALQADVIALLAARAPELVAPSRCVARTEALARSPVRPRLQRV